MRDLFAAHYSSTVDGRLSQVNGEESYGTILLHSDRPFFPPKMVKVVLGIIGVGRIGKLHLQNIIRHVDDCIVKAVADIALEDCREWLAALSIPHVSNNYKNILDDPEIDAVLICSSTNTHSSISLEAARAGKHIFCEKPIDFDIEHIRAVIREVDKAKVKFQTGFNRRYDHNFRAVREAVVSGHVGDVHIAKITSRDPDYCLEYIKNSGGIFYDMTIHDFDMIRFLTGSEATEITAIGGSMVDPKIGEIGDADTVMVTIKFANGALGCIDNSRRAVYGYDQRAEVFGSKGMVKTENERGSLAEFYGDGRPQQEKICFFFLDRYPKAFIEEIRDFVSAVRDPQRQPLVTAFDGLQAVRMAAAATMSLKEGRAVTLSEIDEH